MTGDEGVPGPQVIGLSVNGRRSTVVVDAGTPLLYVLRNDLGLKGTRFGCGTGQCGTCTVLLDGKPAQSCDVPVGSVGARHVTTIEGLAGEGGGLDPLQQAFIDEAAGQCGYCLSGILVSASALLESNPDPSDDEVRMALDTHICRCGAHGRIVRAVRRAAAGTRA